MTKQQFSLIFYLQQKGTSTLDEFPHSKITKSH